MSDDLIKEVIHPGPQAAAYARYGEYPVDYSTGVPKIDIPLYSLNTGDYELPISLSYHASGIKVTDVSTPVGLGWVLNAGGVITRTCRAVPDRVNGNYNLYFEDRSQAELLLAGSAAGSGWGRDWWENVLSGSASYDSETDRYAYNFPGKAGTFRYDSSDGSIYALAHDPIRIEETSSGYKITDTDGTQYYFETPEQCGGSGGQSVGAYYLTSIITGERHNTITFTYGTTSTCQVRYREESYYEANNYQWEGSAPSAAGTPSDFDAGAFSTSCSLHTYNYQSPLLTGISWNGVTISISYATGRLDAQPHRMTSISISEGGNPVRYITLNNNGYFGNNSQNYRLKLSGLTVRGSSSVTDPAQTWSFSYNSLTPPNHYNYTNATASGTRTYEDYWGYWNGHTSTHVIPDGIVPNVTTADRSSVEYYMKMCSLESITYPTGGKTTFTMEANRNGNQLIGGLRVSAISNYDYDGTLLEKRSFEYADAHQSVEITDELFCWEEDVWLFSQGNNGGVDWSIHSGHADGFFASASPILPLSGLSGNPVNYLSVTEYVGGTASSNLGKNVYTYEMDTESSYPGSDEDYYLPPLPVRYYSNEYNNDEGTVPALLVSKEVWRRDGNTYTKQETESYYYTEQTPLHPYYTTGVRIARRGVGSIYSNLLNYEYAPFPTAQDYWDSFVFTNCRAYRRLRLLTGKTVTDHTTGVVVSTSYTYHADTLRTLRPLSEAVTNSDGKEAKTVYTYPFRMGGTVYASMTAANRVDTPVREEYYYGTNIQRTRETTYGVFNSTMCLPKESKEKLGNTTRTLISYDAYDAAGNLRAASTVDGRKFVFLWGYGSRYPVAFFEGLTWSQVNTAAGSTLISNLASCTTTNAATYLSTLRTNTVSPSSLSGIPHLVSTYTYTPGVGMTSETGPDGATRSYTYDALGRLTQLSDNMGEIESYTYAFAVGSGGTWAPNKILRSVKKNAPVNNTARIETTQWYDGLGRPIEELLFGATPSQSNLLTRTEYDQAGRATRAWLPVVTSSYYLSPSAFSTAAGSTYGTSETRPFSENIYEASSLDRVPYAYGPGAAWYAASGGGHPVRTEWMSNTSSGERACKYYYVNGTSLGGGSSNYAADRLSVVKTTDEDGAVTFTFTDKLGRTVMIRQVDGNTYSDTYYVYDDRGQLRYVLQPQYQVTANLAQFAFQYTYDDRGNLTKKQIPGADYIQYVYDSCDRPAYVQDGRRRAAGTNRWYYYTYDNLGRIVTEGECTGQSNTSSPTVLVKNYYDGYSFAGTSLFPTAYFPSTGSWCIGRQTGQELRVLGVSAGSSCVPRAWYYDSRGQVVKEVAGNYDSLGYDTREQTWTYTGLPASIVTTRSSSVSGTPSSQTRSWTYDHVDRLSSETLALGGGTAATVATYAYDNLGRLASRKFAGSTTNTEAYTYDIRSRSTGITHSGFIQDLAYSYGGDVTSTGWKRSSTDTRKAYDFTYDGLHRLKTAAYKEGSTTNHHYTENVNGYDLNGNIMGLSRHGRTGASSWGVIDSLAMTRTGNQLTSVTDVGVSAYSGDFNTSSTTSTYDANGAMISDTGRGISSITWNEINLPKTVTFTNGSTIDYYYAADGTKLQEIRTVSGTAMKIDWCGDLVIEKVGSGTRTAKRLRLDGGYVDLTTSTPAKRHFVRDHLGSIRAVVDDTGTSLETDDYYPLGGPLPTGTATALQPEKYQGKEWNTAAGFNVYDFGARLYDPGLGRWLSLDPMTEQYYFHSPYLFCAGNPMKFVDPEGTHWYTINENGEIQMLMERDNEQYDRLFLYDKQIGPPNLFSSIVVNNQDILRGRSFLQDVPQSVSIQELLNIFFFVSDAYLDREWGLYSDGEFCSLVTSGNRSHVKSPFEQVVWKIHSHSDTLPDDRSEIESMGYWFYNDKDFLNGKLINKNAQWYESNYYNNDLRNLINTGMSSKVYFPLSGHVYRLNSNSLPSLIETRTKK